MAMCPFKFARPIPPDLDPEELDWSCETTDCGWWVDKGYLRNGTALGYCAIHHIGNIFGYLKGEFDDG